MYINNIFTKNHSKKSKSNDLYKEIDNKLVELRNIFEKLITVENY